MKQAKPVVPRAEAALKRHFRTQRTHELVTANRTFPITARVDVQLALERLFVDYANVKLLGIHPPYSQHETLTFAQVLGDQHNPVVIGPLQHAEVDIGEALPARCLRQAIWLSHEGRAPFALLVSTATSFGRLSGTHVEIAAPPGEAGSKLSRRLFDQLEVLVKRTASYRGKVISLEAADNYSGRAGVLRVHKLRDISRKARAAFIKELMRRSAQFYIQNGSNGQLRPEHLKQALEEMLFSGGSLNAKLLGAEGLSRGTVH